MDERATSEDASVRQAVTWKGGQEPEHPPHDRENSWKPQRKTWSPFFVKLLLIESGWLLTIYLFIDLGWFVTIYVTI